MMRHVAGDAAGPRADPWWEPVEFTAISPGSVGLRWAGMTRFMIVRKDVTRYVVRMSVARRGGWRVWGGVSGAFERALAAQESGTVTPRTWNRRTGEAETMSVPQ